MFLFINKVVRIIMEVFGIIFLRTEIMQVAALLVILRNKLLGNLEILAGISHLICFA